MLIGLATPGTAQSSVHDFLAAYLKQDRGVSHLDGAVRLSAFLTPRLVGVLQDAIACGRDWARQQPADSTDKPPFVDCCIFASSPEGIPTDFKVGKLAHMPDGRIKVLVRYIYKDPPGTYLDPSVPLEEWSWTDAVIVQKVGQQYLVDDFLFLRGAPGEAPLLLSKSFGDCRGPKWIGDSR